MTKETELNFKKKLLREEIVYMGQIFKVVRQQIEFIKDNNPITFEVEIAVRTPGVRGILTKGNLILLVREYRSEHQGWDYRLPGGKIFDSFEEFHNVEKSDKMLEYAISAVKKEFLEEVGLEIANPQLLCITKAGATVSWDLYYFEIEEFSMLSTGQNLEGGEVIIPEWKEVEEVKDLCLKGLVKEDRTLGVLLRYILNKEKAFRN